MAIRHRAVSERAPLRTWYYILYTLCIGHDRTTSYVVRRCRTCIEAACLLQSSMLSYVSRSRYVVVHTAARCMLAVATNLRILCTRLSSDSV